MYERPKSLDFGRFRGMLDFYDKGGLLKFHRMLVFEGGCVSVCVCVCVCECLWVVHIQEMKSNPGPVTFKVGYFVLVSWIFKKCRYYDVYCFWGFRFCCEVFDIPQAIKSDKRFYLRYKKYFNSFRLTIRK